MSILGGGILAGSGQTQPGPAPTPANVNFEVLNWRGGKPRPPFKSQAAAFRKGLLTIGIDLDGVLWTLKDTPAGDAEGVWIDFDNANWEFEQNQRLPVAAINTGDFWYRYDEDVWELYDGTQYVVYQDRDISAFLPNHIFLGQFANAENAVQSIVGYDRTKTYLAYFTVTEQGQTGREVRQLQSYTAGTAEGISWVSTDETLHHVSAELHKLIQVNANSVKGNQSAIKMLLETISDVRSERAGVELLTAVSGKTYARVTNINQGATLAEASATPSFSSVDLFANPRNQTDVANLGRFDHIRITIHLLDNSNNDLARTEVSFDYNEWLALKALPLPAQGSTQQANIRDNRALIFNWQTQDRPAAAGTGGNAGARADRAIAWVNSFRELDNTIYVGRTNETNSRLLVAIKGYVVSTFGIQVRGYRGAS